MKFRRLSSEIDGVVHFVLVENPEFFDTVVDSVHVRLPARVLCEVAVHGRTPRGPGCVTVHRCIDAPVDCMSCLVEEARG